MMPKAEPMPEGMRAALAVAQGSCRHVGCGLTLTTLCSASGTERLCVCCDLGPCGHPALP